MSINDTPYLRMKSLQMKQLKISVEKSKYDFITELLNNFHSVQVN